MSQAGSSFPVTPLMTLRSLRVFLVSVAKCLVQTLVSKKAKSRRVKAPEAWPSGCRAFL